MAAQEIVEEIKQDNSESFFRASEGASKLYSQAKTLKFNSKDEMIKWLETALFFLVETVELAKFDGYYELNTGGYIQIQTVEYHVQSLPFVLIAIEISVSKDGKKSTSFFYGEKGITFDDGKLTIDSKSISAELQLKREEAEYGSIYSILTKMSGTIGTVEVTGINSFNAVGLQQLLGSYSSSKSSMTLDIPSISKINYNDGSGTTTYDSFIYIPSMFVLEITEIKLGVFLGTSGVHGKAAFMMPYKKPPAMLYTIASKK